MKECHVIAEISTENQRSLQTLLRAIALSKGQFSLIFVRCNYERLREEILVDIHSLSKDTNLHELVLSPSTTALHTTIIKELFDDNPNLATDSQPSAVMIFGLESIINLEDQIINVNQVRDIYAESFQFPLVFWLKDQVATLLSRVAPDFKSWAATTIRFEMEPEDLVAMIRHETELLFAKVLEVGAQRFLSNAALDLDPKSSQHWEIELARNDLLRLYGIKLEPELEACIEFVLAQIHHANDQIDNALSHYQRSLDFWQHQVETSSAHLLREAVVLFHLGLCYRRMADLYPELNKGYWQKALSFFRECLEVLEASQRKDLVAKFILAVCEMLQRLQAWEDLQKLAQESLELHKTYGTKAQIAQDYGFLATVAASCCDWLEADKLANAALAIAEDTPEVSRQQEAWYLLLLGRAQRHLGDPEEAINHLEWAKVVCEPQYEPCLYIEILEELRSLYFFAHRDYLEAFNLKQEKIQIEHQYGFRAFIGASQLQPQRYRINPICGVQISPCSVEVAQEIINSGRQQDVNRLIERISRADCKLTVVHGPSGVGKSSTLKAGLVPALKQKVIGDRLPLTVFLSIYTDWLTGLFCSLNHAIAQTDISLISQISCSNILEKLRLLSERNYTIILIFDQIEEFFFVNTDINLRIEFYKLLSACLNIPFVKIILCLREDYLHYLLEFERLSNEKIEHTYDIGVINKNILDKDIRYYLGKFSTQDAIEIIHNLTQRSHYKAENELINQLVIDLAGELDEVHPIELQIVGVQLQVEKITTLEEYKSCGGSQKLVKRWLEEAIKDCGEENQELGWKLLFELTDEKGTRPLKTKAELGERETFSSSALDMILEIMVGSGLVVRVLEESGERYQLVHDYLVEPIRQKNNYCIVAEFKKVQIEKNRAEVAQKLSQEQLYLVLQRRLREARLTGIVLATMVATIGALWWQANVQKQAAVVQTIRAERSETNLKISGLTAASEALFASNKEFDALLESLRAFRLLKQTNTVQPETRMRVVTALQQAVYGVAEINRLEGHHDIVWGVSFSPDNQLLASGSTDRTVKLWRSDGGLLQTLNGHSDAVTSVSFSPDGKLLASASLDKTIRLWHRDSINAEFDPWSYKTIEGHGDWVYSVNFSPDGKLLASGGKDASVKLWSSNGNRLKVLRGHTGWVNWVNFSPDSQFLASASEDQTVKIWRRDGTLAQTLLGHSSGVTYVAFSPDGQMLATGSRDKTVKLWRREELKSSKNGFVFRLVRTLQHSGTVWSLSFSTNGQNLATAGDDKKISLWNISERNSLENRPYRTFKGHNDAIASVAFSPDNKLLASGSYDKSVKLWRLDPPKLSILKGHEDRVLSVAWSPDGKILVSGSRDRTLKLWQRYSNTSGVETRLYKTLLGHTDRVASVSFDPLGQMFVSGSYDKTLKLWRRDGLFLKTLSGHSGSVMSVSFSPDGQLLASASKDKTVKLWNREGKLLKTLNGHQGWVNSVSFTSDSQLLASASDDQTVKLWRRDGTLLKTFSPHESWVLGVSFSPTDKLMASASWDNTVKLWRWDGTLLKTLLKGYSDSVNAVNFSPNGEVLAAASWDSTVKLWSHDGKLIKTLNGHRAPVLSVSFSPDGQTLASASDDKTIILWNLDLHNLLSRGCNWVRDYLQSNRNVDQRDRSLCN
ncbi:tetratricopeptide repeat protein [Aetokthonos hydrillicola Thurmond2011]|jgi:WD40 repeat protein|uniref:Tetratricopeptide repeat protein n=1 Tax=Aetokthonos hydrillicola Thurmond2011 TaxID=2712845 RepID=A0AAP5IBX0_9CYAN|nr:tetratricopeptide repeat protein [Aetokthonos hydrillicola]MBO3460805.1 tetratricopeptide repeat protein [Aetokthonos hydrillicola CCALA 1050]MBW4588268.1 tetratricopeptide repeat protein [Aetokthonos hydrillicola CCALA 1050]MDR9897252.1 tetratricopeptide repeat protein [Aetokthonos hydrillicola Thurmond2011]